MGAKHTTNIYQCLLFDWDGTLADSIDPLTVAFNSTCDDMGIARPSDQEALRRSFGNHSPVILQQLLKDSAQNIPFEQFVADFETRFAGIYRTVPTMMLKGGQETLKNLKAQGYILCVVSNAPRPILDKGLRETGVQDLFALSVCADEFPPKPSPLMLEHALLKCDCLPEHAVMIGDHFNDILAAKAAGICAVGVLSGSQDREGLAYYEPDAVFDNVNALPEWLASLKKEA